MNSSALLPVPYCGRAPAPEELWARWNWDLPLLILLAAALVAGVVLFRAEPRQRMVWVAGCVALLAAFVSPLCALSSGLFAARSLHHLLVAALAGPLLGCALAGRYREMLQSMPLGLLTGAHALIFWLWHVPGPYAAALSGTLVYWIMQGLLLGSAVVFWGALYSTRHGAAQIGALLAVVFQMGLLGAIITFAPTPLYAPHFLTTALYGFSPLEDQQLAGLVMWVGSAPLFLGAGIPLLRRLLADAKAAA